MKKSVSKALKKKMIIMITAGAVLALLTAVNDRTDDPASKGYLIRNPAGGGDKEESVTMTTGGKKIPVTLHIKEQEITPEEAGKRLAAAKEKLPAAVLGKQMRNHVNSKLKLPESLSDGLIEVQWMSDHPEYVSWDGTIGKDVPESGARVTLTASLLLGEQSAECRIPITVFPDESGGIAAKAQKAVDKENKSTIRKVKLPDEIDGKPVRWQGYDSGSAIRIFVLGIFGAALLWYIDFHKEEQAKEIRRKNLALDYPSMISQLVLYLGAGLSMRSSFERFQTSGRIRTEKGRELHPGYVEAARCAREMQCGVTEKEAYERFGRRAELPEYRAAASLLIQNQQKGGREILNLLNENAREAQIKRRSEAKVMGEAAGTKLLVPMVGLLVLVVAILMIPAMMNFSI